MRECDRIAELLERVVEGDPWHGSSVLQLVQDLTATDAARHVLPGVHSIWEIVLHMTAWCDEVRARLDGAPAGPPAAGDWPQVRHASAAAWTSTVGALVESHRALAAAIRRVGDPALDTPVLDPRERATGVGLSRYLTLHGLVHHTTYHAGQLGLLRRAIDAAR